MEPLTPNDPLWKLMGKARPVELRSNFTANVLRAARNESQETGWWPRVHDWFARQHPLLFVSTSVAAFVVACLLLIAPEEKGDTPLVVAIPVLADADMAVIADEDVTLPLDSLDHMDALVAMENTSSLTDTELQFLLY